MRLCKQGIEVQPKTAMVARLKTKVAAPSGDELQECRRAGLTHSHSDMGPPNARFQLRRLILSPAAVGCKPRLGFVAMSEEDLLVRAE